jgi:hypothetical protein
MDAEAYREYCRDRYHFEAMLETERLKMKADLEPKKVTIELMVELAVDAVSCPASILENVRTILSGWITVHLQSLRYLGPFKKKIQDVIGNWGELKLAAKEALWEWIEVLIDELNEGKSVTFNL